jgi:hypothetical protein
VTTTAVVSDGNNASVVVRIYFQSHASPNVISYHHPSHHPYMNPLPTNKSNPQIKTKCTTCTNKSCKSLNRKPAATVSKPLSFTPRMAAITAAVCCSSSLRSTALNRSLRHTDAVWPASLPQRQKRPSKSSPLGNESPACSAKHTLSDEYQDISKPMSSLARRTISDG